MNIIKIFLIFYIMFFCYIENTYAYKATLIKCIDGDTFVVKDLNNETHKIRLYGIDAPEIKQNFGIEAKNFLNNILSNSSSIEVIVIKKDKYKRDAAIVFSDGLNINYTLVRNGYAWFYPEFCTLYMCHEIKEAHHTAFEEKRGLWIEENPISPFQFRMDHN